MSTEASHPLPQSGASAPTIAAVVENRAREVGLAVLELDRLTLSLVQFTELTRHYATTKGQLAHFEPRVIVTVSSVQSEQMLGVNQQLRASEYELAPAPRGCFDDTKAIVSLEKLADAAGRELLASSNLKHSIYLALGAAGAVLHYVEDHLNMTIMHSGLSLCHVQLADRVQIGTATAAALELVQQHGSHTARPKSSCSLFAWLNHTCTAAGAKMLKANILQPPRSVAATTARMDAVQELLSQEPMLADLIQCLKAFPRDPDRACLGITAASQGTARSLHTGIQSLLWLREGMGASKGLATCLEPAESDLLQDAARQFSSAEVDVILAVIARVLDDGALPQSGSFANATQQCFALKQGLDPLLDLARITFTQLTEEIHDLVASYRTKHKMPLLKVSYTAKRGFLMLCQQPGQTAPDGREVPALPRSFIDMEKKGRLQVTCTTTELTALNSRLASAAAKCLALTEQAHSTRSALLQLFTNNMAFEQALQETLQELPPKMPLIRGIIDSLSLLDMLASFAQVVCSSPRELVRPVVTDQGPLAIVAGRHPLLEQLVPQGSFQANDCYLASCASYASLTGPNMSGKSTYLRQIALIVVMAHMGCYVPASFAHVRLVDGIFSRMGAGESIEHSSSSFMVEMQEAANIVGCATSQSLVLIDELGCATSTQDGVAIAWALSEHLIALEAYTVFATHFARLCQLEQLYPNCKTLQFGCQQQQGRVVFDWKLDSHSSQQSRYGLMLAPQAGIPEAIVAEATAIADEAEQAEAALAIRQPQQGDPKPGAQAWTTEELRMLYEVVHNAELLAQEWQHHGMTAAELAERMAQLKEQVAPLEARLDDTSGCESA